MDGTIKRRSLLKMSIAAAGIGGVSCLHDGNAQSPTETRFRGKLIKSLYYGMLPKGKSVAEQFMIAKQAGFEGIEVPTIEREADVAEFKEAARSSGVVIHSIMNSDHWKYPFSSDDPEVVKKGMEGMKTSLRNAKALGADTVLLVPAVVNDETTYQDAWIRSRDRIKELLPMADELQINIAVENVWNKFLLSPIEFTRYVDEFEHPRLRAYFDVGNIVFYGIPMHWIRTLGTRIVKVHIKGFDAKNRTFTNLGDGTIDWPAVRQAFSDVGYKGYVGAEIKGGDAKYLADVSRRMDRFFAGKKV